MGPSSASPSHPWVGAPAVTDGPGHHQAVLELHRENPEGVAGVEDPGQVELAQVSPRAAAAQPAAEAVLVVVLSEIFSFSPIFLCSIQIAKYLNDEF